MIRDAGEWAFHAAVAGPILRAMPSADSDRRKPEDADDQSPAHEVAEEIVEEQDEHEDERQAKRRSAISVQTIHDSVSMEGEEELGRSTSALAWSGLAAGLSISFSGIAVALLSSHLPKDAPWHTAVAMLGYPMGFLIVILGRQQLFDENTLTVILPLMKRRDRACFLNVMRVWAVVLLSNLVGGALVAAALHYTDALGEDAKAALSESAARATVPDFWTILVRGIFGGWLIALLVWLLPAADEGKVLVILLLTYLVGLAHFSHVIAGFVEATYAAFAGEVGWSAALLKFLPAALIGNTVGGVALTAAINHAQVVAGEPDAREGD